MSRNFVMTGAVLSLVSGCAATGFPADTDARAASGLPVRFVIQGSQPDVAEDPATCRNPVIDPADGAQLTLLRSDRGRGDYEVTAGRYGARSDELLRIDCASGTAIGLVRR